MRLFEIVGPTFYLMCKAKQSEGSIQRFEGSVYPLGKELEALLESRRPEGQLERTKCLYLLTRPDGSTAFVYRVEATTQVHRNHTGWLKMLMEADPSQEGVQASYALGYWSTEVCPEAPEEPWEHRTLQAKLIKRIGGSGRL